MELEDLAAKLKPILGEAVDRLWLLYKTGSPAERREIESLFHMLAADALDETFEAKHVLLPPPPEGAARGDYPLGTVMFGPRELWPFGLREHEWIQHVAIFGRTGSGKTNVGFLIARLLAARAKPFLVFDWKRNYRDLRQLPELSELLVHTVGRDAAPFGFNPLAPPPGTQPEVWLKKLIEIMCHVYYLGEGVAYLLQKAIDQAYRSHGVYEGKGTYPTMRDVLMWLESRKVKGREALWMESALRTLATLCFGETGRVLNSEATNLSELLRRRVVLELDALDNSDKTFLIESMLLWIHHYRMQEPEREAFKHAIIIEEAHHVLLRRRESKESIMDIVLREIRELGESIILLDQHPSLISVPSLGNTYCTIAMSLKHGSDVSAIRRALQLIEEEAGFLGRLDTGYGIVRLQGRWHKPFLVKFPHVAVRKGSVTDRDLAGQTVSDSAVKREIPPIRAPISEIRGVRASGKLTQEEEAMLGDIAQHPYSGTVARYARLGFSAYKGSAAVAGLEAKGLLRRTNVPMGRGRLTLHQLTDSAVRRLNNYGFNASLPRQNASLEHEYWRATVKERLIAEGYGVEEEVPRPEGGRVDLVARRPGQTVAVEIETGMSDAVENVRRDLGAGYDRVIVVATNRRVKAALERKLSTVHLNFRIEVVCAAAFDS